MNDFNEATIIGRATDTVKTTPFGERIRYSFVVAVNYFSKTKSQAYSEFIPICFWKNNPNPELERIKKGDNIVVVGRISIRAYEKNNQKKWVTEIVGRFVRVFKVKKETRDITDLLELIRSNQPLLDEIKASNQITICEQLIEKNSKELPNA